MLTFETRTDGVVTVRQGFGGEPYYQGEITMGDTGAWFDPSPQAGPFTLAETKQLVAKLEELEST